MSKIFQARIPDYHGDDEDSWEEFEAFDFEQAAEKCAESYYDADPFDANDLDLTVEVKCEKGIKRFNVLADYSVNFYASEVQEND